MKSYFFLRNVVPDICEAGYFGPQCTEKCHCLNDVACDKDTGECPQHECDAGYEVYDGEVNCTGNKVLFA